MSKELLTYTEVCIEQIDYWLEKLADAHWYNENQTEENQIKFPKGK